MIVNQQGLTVIFSRVPCDEYCSHAQVDRTTKMMHSLAHAVRLCSTDTEGCMFYGKTELPENIQLENFEVRMCL